jgi:aspartate aminotransferase
MATKAKQMKAEGIDVVSFAAGEPDFDTPNKIVQAAKAALDAGKTRYTPTPGTLELREAVAAKYLRENKLEYKPSETMVSTGAKQCVYNAVQVLVDEGDEVLIPAPFWMTYEAQVDLAGGKSVIVPSSLSDGFVPDLDRLAGAVTPRTRAIMLNTPCNPTGAAIPTEVLKQIGALAVKHDLWIISDEIYEHLTYGHDHVSIAALSPAIKERTVTITGCSKSFAMTGWRIGFIAGPLDVIKCMTDLQDQVTSGATTFSQSGAVEALRLDVSEIEGMRATFEKRRDLIVSLLKAIPDVEVFNPLGAFYVFPDVSAYLGTKFKDDVQLADWLLEEAKVATVPGGVFYGPGHLRLSYATSEADIKKGVERLADALAKIPR